ncbi:MAG: hypothetical protein A3C53_07555 [Omnitrophica WOR_2 bacterium RIFCSPHIGHO2_02_FULL_68_15]|nr:MAG: hypothetical protein A3C53_07555 [Omnitrophica WOR_2 bacterium RIFCSPHIGHO2_02_FULL_68_15]
MWWPLAVLVAIVSSILVASRQRLLAPLFRWLPVPLWCYALPMAAAALGWLAPADPAWKMLTRLLLPLALALLLLGVDLGGLRRTGGRLLAAAATGAAGVVIGAPLGVWLLHSTLPPEAWKGAGALAATWTGGTMNMLAARALLDVPDAVFAPLVVVDAVTAYGWMALLVAASGFQAPLNRWLRAQDDGGTSPQMSAAPTLVTRTSLIAGIALAAVVTLAGLWLAGRAPTSGWISSANGWAVLLVTTATLGLSALPAVRRAGEAAGGLGYPCLYLVLAATGAQASPEALWKTPAWVAVGLVTVAVHGACLVVAGRLLRIPVGSLATASQANLGGVVSAPLVGAVYHRSLAPAGLVLALAGNALGTYLGWAAASMARWLIE